MKFERASGMTLLSKRLGIDPTSRMSFVTAKDGIRVWDMGAEVEYTIGGKDAPLTSVARPVPDAVKSILVLSDEELHRLLLEHPQSSWSNEHAIIESELAYRGKSNKN